ncbi:MAG: S41 family peptidase [Flavobacteriales bacterium]|nr:S41 family peptidase [Flavobacteriales bacterium]MDG1781750.1 S41 family peptidase [Flavobacteriales bacterium]
MLKKLRKKTWLLILPLAFGAFSFVATEDYFEISKNLEIFTSLYKELNVYYVDETQPGTLMKTGIDAMLKSLDPYTVYYPESKIEDYQFMTTGQYGGIGALINKVDGMITVAEPYEGFAAQTAGLIAGDIIKSIDGENIEGKEVSDISSLLKGQAGTKVMLVVDRPGKGEMSFEVLRQDVQIPDVPYYGMLDDETGYVSLRSFTKTSGASVRKCILELKDQQGMQQLVFDLRGNGGGLLREAINIVNFFVPKGTEIVSTKGKLQEWNKTHSALNEPIAPDLPLVVLVDGGSASASEIVSGALQDLDRAVIIGSTTFGKGLVQQTKDINYNTKLKLTVAKYYIPSGRCIQKLDYSSREGEKVDQVADSLIQPFKTAGGRLVYDGRGIAPDLDVSNEDMSNILGGLLRNEIIFKYATEFVQKGQGIEEPEQFDLGDNYQDFVDYALAQDFSYDTRTEKILADLKEMAEAEKYYDGAENAFAALEKQIAPKKEADLQRFREQIEFTVEEEIVSRYYYQKGAIRYGLTHDPYLNRAFEVFGDEYTSILSGTGADN